MSSSAPSLLSPSHSCSFNVVSQASAVTKRVEDVAAAADGEKTSVKSTLAAARWIGFSEEVVEALTTPTPAKELQPAIDLLERLPKVLLLHTASRIHERITKATLMDIEVWLQDYHQKHGVWGFTAAEWLNEHFSGKLYALGRLQFQISHYDLPTVPDVLAPGDAVLNVHIPATGKLEDAACSESFRQALEFFPRHFPEHKFKAFVCESWIMDPSLLQILPAESNLTCFQKRFRHIKLPDATDQQMWERVFGSIPKELADAPQKTSLQRAILKYIKAGGKCCMAGGYILRTD